MRVLTAENACNCAFGHMNFSGTCGFVATLQFLFARSNSVDGLAFWRVEPDSDGGVEVDLVSSFGSKSPTARSDKSRTTFSNLLLLDRGAFWAVHGYSGTGTMSRE